jgi:hypothetical protein
MLRGFRLLIAVLVFAVPLQGVAAAFCATMHGLPNDAQGTCGHEDDKAPVNSHFDESAACCVIAAVAQTMFLPSFQPARAPAGADSVASAGIRLDTPDRPPLVV